MTARGKLMRAILKASDIPATELTELVEQIQAPDQLRIWAEGFDGWALDLWGGPSAEVRWYAAGRLAGALKGREVLAQAQAGRLFAPSGELKWRVLPTPAPPRCRVVFLGNPDWLPGRLHVRDELDRLGMTSSVESAILWGQKTGASDGDWIELRIPHRFRYPVSELDAAPGGGVGVRVWTEVWCDRAGDPHFIRLRDLTPYAISEES
jgi:hypothetical protein